MNKFRSLPKGGQEKIVKYTGFDDEYPLLRNNQEYNCSQLAELLNKKPDAIKKRLVNKYTFTSNDLRNTASQWHRDRSKLANTSFINDDDGKATSKQFSQQWLSTKALVIKTNT